MDTNLSTKVRTNVGWFLFSNEFLVLPSTSILKFERTLKDFKKLDKTFGVLDPILHISRPPFLVLKKKFLGKSSYKLNSISCIYP
jgi:hypothetical protein